MDSYLDLVTRAQESGQTAEIDNYRSDVGTLAKVIATTVRANAANAAGGYLLLIYPALTVVGSETVSGEPRAYPIDLATARALMALRGVPYVGRENMDPTSSG